MVNASHFSVVKVLIAAAVVSLGKSNLLNMISRSTLVHHRIHNACGKRFRG